MIFQEVWIKNCWTQVGKALYRRRMLDFLYSAGVLVWGFGSRAWGGITLLLLDAAGVGEKYVLPWLRPRLPEKWQDMKAPSKTARFIAALIFVWALVDTFHDQRMQVAEIAARPPMSVWFERYPSGDEELPFATRILVFAHEVTTPLRLSIIADVRIGDGSVGLTYQGSAEIDPANDHQLNVRIMSPPIVPEEPVSIVLLSEERLGSFNILVR